MAQLITIGEKMKKFLLLLSLFSTAVFAAPGCYNSREVTYLSTELARESRQIVQNGRFSRHGDRFITVAKRLAWAAWELVQAAKAEAPCRSLERIFYEKVDPAFKDLMQNVRGPRREDHTEDIKDIRRAFQDLRKELMDDNGRGPRYPHPVPGHGPGPDHGPRH
jgi:hypothetical protein